VQGQVELLHRIEAGHDKLQNKLAELACQDVAGHEGSLGADFAGLGGQDVAHPGQGLACLGDDGIGASNGYFRAIRTFCRWMLRSRRAGQDPLVGMSCIKVTDANRTRKRRPLTDEEAKALIEATRESPESFMGLSGPDRAMLYLVAVNTGLRASELASLKPESFELGGERSLVRCQAGYTKNGQEAELPMRRDVAAMVRAWLAEKPAATPV
jgi:integrase